MLAADGTLLEMNRAGLKLIEADTPEQVCGLCIYPLVTAEYRPAFQALTEGVFRGESGILEFEGVGLKGHRLWLETHATPLRDECGRVTSALSITRDITERKRLDQQLAERERHLRAILDSEPECVKMLAADGTLLEMNRAGLKLIEADTPEQVCGLCIYPLVTAEYRPAFQALTERVFRGESGILEFEAVGLKGHLRWLETNATPLRDDAGQVTSLLSITRDITERKRMEQTLRENQARLQLLVKSSNVGLWDWNLLTNEVFFSAEWKSQLGYTDDELPNRLEEWERRVHLDDLRQTLAAVSDFREARRSNYDIEFRLRHKDGSWRWVMTRADMIREPDGRPIRMMGCHVDITERKRAEAELTESEAKYHSLFTGMTEGFALCEVICDAAGTPCDFRYLEVNRAFEIQSGLKVDQVIGTTVRELLPDIESSWIEILCRVAVTGQPVRFEKYNHNTFRYYEVFAFSTAPGFFAILFLDISERKQAEIALRESDERHRTLFDVSPDALFLVDSTGRLLDINRTAVTRYGYSRDELLQLSVRELAAPDLREQTAACVQAALKQGGQFEWRHRRKDGSEFPVEIATQTLTLKGQSVVLSCVRDLTERHQAEARLHESNRRFATIFRASPVGNCISRFADGVFFEVNEAFAQITGHTREELLGRSSLDVTYWLDPEDRVKLVQAVADNGSVRDWEVSFRRKDGSIGHSLRSVERLTLDGEDCILTVLSDITERKRNEEELRVGRERLETLSRQLIATQESERRHLARELHDEIGQELTSIKLNLKTLEPSLPAGANLIHDTLAIADQALQQVRSLALDLRPSMLDDIGLAAALRWCLNRQAHRAGFAPHFLAEPPEIAVSPEVAITCFRVVQESLTNISRHARARNVRVEVRQYESAIDLQVHDDGIGFDVTAATDQATRGASLGLLGMRERAELVGGLIDIESAPTAGTTIHARFPLSQTSGSDQ